MAREDRFDMRAYGLEMLLANEMCVVGHACRLLDPTIRIHFNGGRSSYIVKE